MPRGALYFARRLWWEKMPQIIRNNIDSKMETWAKEYRYDPSGPTAVRRRLEMLLHELRNPKAAGFSQSFTAVWVTAS